MIVVIPDEIDFSGALEGLVFIRQTQIRYKYKTWSFSIENPETTYNPFNLEDLVITESDNFPDLVARKDFFRKWGQWSFTVIGRNLTYKDENQFNKIGYGISTGGRIKIGDVGSNLKIMATYGNGLGRYLSAGFISGGVLNDAGEINTIALLNGYIAYDHYWNKILSSSFSASAFQATYPDVEISDMLNKSAYSLSGNIKYNPVPELRFGLEYMYAYRGVASGINGSFHRIQLGIKYSFGYLNSVTNEKN